MRVKPVILWPFAQLLGLVGLMAPPVVAVGLAYCVVAVFELPDGWFVLVAVLAGIYSVIVFRIWRAASRASLRAIVRGAVAGAKQKGKR